MRLATVSLACVLQLSACGEGRPAPRGPDRDGTTLPPARDTIPGSSGERAATSPSGACIRGGTTRNEVLAIMGEPDSVVYGAWIYGRSSITFGYGAVLDFSNEGDNLPVC